MYKRRLEEAAAFIAAADDKNFDMRSTCGCIAGHIVQMKDPELVRWAFWPEISAMARRFLGLSPETAKALFLPKFIDDNKARKFSGRKARDKRLALRVLRRLARTGKVVWR